MCRPVPGCRLASIQEGGARCDSVSSFQQKKGGEARCDSVSSFPEYKKRGGEGQKKSREGVAHCDRVSPFSMQERLAGHKVLVRLEDKPRDGARPVGKSCFRIFVAGPA